MNGENRIVDRESSVRILTLHNVRNYGSVLQAYATQQLISAAGSSVEIIDFHREGIGDDAQSYLRQHPHGKNPVLKLFYSLIRGRDIAHRAEVFRDFINENLILSQEKYCGYSDLVGSVKDCRVKYCVGSDQVWNINYNRDNRPFLLSFVPEGCDRFSFSSSIGMGRLPKAEEDRLRTSLQSFSGVSVREREAAIYLEKLGISAEVHIDPTLVMPKDEWSAMCSPIDYSPESYVLAYQLNSGKNLESIAQYVSRLLGLPIVRIDYWSTRSSRGMRKKVCPPVGEFLALLKNAAFVVTDSFHGSVFSYQFERRFVPIVPSLYGGRIRNLLEMFSDEPRAIQSKADVVEAVSYALSAEVNYSVVELERQRAKEYLREHVGL